MNTLESPSKRRFLLGAAAAAAGLAAAGPASAAGKSGPRRIMVIDLNRCIGCQSCVLACKGVRDVPGEFRTTVPGGEDAGRRAATFTPKLCNQCAKPACVPACKAGALKPMADGVVALDRKACTACGECVKACPFQAIHQDSAAGGRADKCEFCRTGSGGGLPACVEACASHARIFGDERNPSPELARVLKRGDLRDVTGAAPGGMRVLYVPLKKKETRA